LKKNCEVHLEAIFAKAKHVLVSYKYFFNWM